MKNWMKKAMVSVAVCSCLSSLSIGVSAESVDLTKNQTHVFSDSIVKTFAVFSGRNSPASERDVAFISQYKTGWWTWNDDIARRDIGPGENCPSTVTFQFAEEKQWRLQLNPIGTDTKGCSATGTII